MQLIWAVGILALTIALAVSRIKLMKFTVNHATAAISGAVLMTAFKIVHPSEWLTVISFLRMPIITIASLMIISLVADYSGLFNRVMLFFVERANGDGRKLYGLLFLVGSLLGMLFSSYAVILLFAPMAFSLVDLISKPSWKLENKIPYYFAILSMGNLVGGLSVSNPINLLVATRFDISFIEYARWMILPSVVATAITFCGLIYFFKNSISEEFKVLEKMEQSHEQKLFQLSVAISLGTTGLFIIFSRESISQFVIPVSALVNVVLFLVFSHEKVSYLLKEVGWDLFIFMYGMCIIVLGLRNAGLVEIFKRLVQLIYHNHFSGLSFFLGLFSAVSSAVINNNVTVDFLTWVIKDFNIDMHEIKMLAYSVIIGGDIGPKMFPFGSLVGIMWFKFLKRRGVKIGFMKYMKIGIPISVSAIILALVALNLEYGLSFL